MRISFAFTIASCLLVFICCKKQSAPGTGGTLPNAAFLHTEGSFIKDKNGKTLQLKGIAFGNEVWSDNLPLTHHNEADFIRLKNMHANTIRFYMNYKIFESDAAPYSYKQSGWDWIDTNIAWAKKHDIGLILNMHVPQGGYQSQGTGDALWNIPENQNRLTALWAAIAEKYKDEPAVIGYGLVNEPVPVTSLQQWQQLAQRIVNAIRAKDKHHIVFVEKPIWIKNVQYEDANYNFPAINDNNLVYEFHSYDPFQYTHQLFSWGSPGNGGKYPDENILSYTNGRWYTATFNNPRLAAGNNEWAYFEGEKYLITDAKIKIGLPALVGASVNGTVYFDDIAIKEYDSKNNFTRTVLSMNLNNKDGWGYWSSNNTGMGDLSLQNGNNDAASLYIKGSTGDCNLSNYNKAFITKPGYSYQICGWMKGENVAAGASCMLRIDFINTDDPVYSRNKDYLLAVLKKYADFSVQKNIPVYLGEFGAGVHCFENNKGGLQWVADMTDIIKGYNIHFTYHAYHEDSFGLYFGYGTLPDPNNANQPLIDLLTQKLQ